MDSGIGAKYECQHQGEGANEFAKLMDISGCPVFDLGAPCDVGVRKPLPSALLSCRARNSLEEVPKAEVPGLKQAKIDNASGLLWSDHIKQPLRIALTMASGRLMGHLCWVWMVTSR